MHTAKYLTGELVRKHGHFVLIYFQEYFERGLKKFMGNDRRGTAVGSWMSLMRRACIA